MSTGARRWTMTWLGATDLTVLCLLAVSLPLLAVESYTMGFGLMLALNAVVLGLVSWDFSRLRRHLAQLEWAWKAPRLSVAGRRFDLELSVYNALPETVRLDVEPRWPRAAGVGPASLVLDTERRGWANLGFHAVPLQAGLHRAEGLKLRVYGPAGFLYADVDMPLAAEMNVSLAMPGAGRKKKKRRRPKLPPSHREGLRTVRRKARSGAVASLRQYQPGDPMRSVDWKASSRRHRLIAREFEPELAPHIYMALEAGRGMGRRFGEEIWYDQAVRATLTAVRSAIAAERSLSLYVFDGRLRVAEGRLAGTRQFPALCKSLGAVEPQEVEPDYGLLARAVSHVRRKGNNMVIVSALSAKALREELEGELGRLSGRFRLQVVRIEAPECGIVTSEDFYRPEQYYRSAYLRMTAGHDFVLDEELRHHGGRLVLTEPGKLTQTLMALMGL